MTIVTTHLNEHEQLSIQRTDPNKNHAIPLYINIGRDGLSKHNIKGVDSAYLFSSLSGASSWFFWSLVRNRDFETNLCDVSKMILSPTEKGRVSRAYAELSKKHLLVRYKQGIYLINPKIVLPKFARFEAIWDKWVATCSKRGIPAEEGPLQLPQQI